MKIKLLLAMIILGCGYDETTDMPPPITSDGGTFESITFLPETDGGTSSSDTDGAPDFCPWDGQCASLEPLEGCGNSNFGVPCFGGFRCVDPMEEAGIFCPYDPLMSTGEMETTGDEESSSSEGSSSSGDKECPVETHCQVANEGDFISCSHVCSNLGLSCHFDEDGYAGKQYLVEGCDAAACDMDKCTPESFFMPIVSCGHQLLEGTITFCFCEEAC